jgi:transposase-like protein
MKKRQGLNRELKLQICKERFEEGKSTNELAKKYNVCQRTIIRASNEYRKSGEEAFAEKNKKAKPEESLENKIKRLEKENEFLRRIQKELLPYAKKK